MALNGIPFPFNNGFPGNFVRLEGFEEVVDLAGSSFRTNGNQLTARSSSFTTELRVDSEIKAYKNLTGSAFQVATVSGDGQLQGTGSAFLNELVVGDIVLINNIEVEIVSISSNTVAIITEAQTIASQATAERLLATATIASIENDYAATLNEYLSDSNLIIPASDLRVTVDGNNGVFEIIATNEDAIVIENPTAISTTVTANNDRRVLRSGTFVTQLKLEPVPTNPGSSMTVYYVPTLPKLVSDNDSSDLPDQFEEFLIQYAVVETMKIEESDTSAQERTLALLADSIRKGATTRSADYPKKPIEIESDYETLLGPGVDDYGNY